ncbi:hypothetical protein COT77_03565 [Candidatus Berkelbacteria bacterium CG10_big_fil_rev_8_21_14_0_10_41_12]|uniref:Peptidase M50 domain-containing protein n=1 Tax=Candidatus Berkelbacteria bacterium CG10_big_fil_rev_8_21_14_0_10_41_12 TaxID=1974513 RepID=A0A2M6WW88_9BACT|nr:MAG: hypothetical protein COT77_03565 [Candidatus Berkelbacteria bacterium CG10_big_fil_rev_8_21_14_0_10_41_12]
MFLLTLIVFIVIIGILILFHELGHFSVAKFSGVKVEEFGIGFPPRLLKIKKGETIYSINAIPFGGFVRLLGEDGKSDAKNSFNSKKTRIKIAIIAAGVVMNFIFAGVLFSIGYMIGMSPIRLNPDKFGGTRKDIVVVGSIVDGSAAQGAGIKVGDEILGFASPEDFNTFTTSHKGQEVKIDLKRSKKNETKDVFLGQGEVPLGVGLISIPIVKLGFLRAIAAGFTELVYTTYFVLKMIIIIIGQLLFQFKLSQDIAGPVGIFNITGRAVSFGLVYVLQLAAILSINLGIINFIPFPALDGGKAALLFAEGIARRKLIRAELENILSLIGFALLIILLTSVTVREIIKLL